MEIIGDYFLPYQQKWIDDDSPMKLCRKSRRAGFTYATSFRHNEKCLMRRNFTQWVTSRDELTAREYITDYIAKWAKASNAICRGLMGENYEVVDEVHGIRAFTVTYKETNSRIVSLSSTPEAFAGKGGDVMIDEADLHKDSGRVIDMAVPCTTWGNQVEVLSALSVDGGPVTPFCNLVSDVLNCGNPMGWSFHDVSILIAVDQGFVEKINQVSGSKYSREEWLAMMRAKCRNEEAWNTQFLMIPSSEGAALLPYDLIASCEIPPALAIPSEEGRHLRYAGFDVGRTKDPSAYFELELRGDVLHQVFYETLLKTSFPVQIEFLQSRLKNPLVVRLCIDYTGMGGPLAEALQRDFGKYRVEGVTFSAKVKEALAMPLRAAFEDRAIRIAAIPEIRNDLHKVRKSVTAAGNLRFEGERDDDGHSDRFWALALALHAKGQSGGPCDFEPSAHSVQAWEKQDFNNPKRLTRHEISEKSNWTA